MAGEHESGTGSRDIRSWLKKPVVWFGGIVVAALGVAITNALVPRFGEMIGRVTQGGDVVIVREAQPVKSEEGGTVAFSTDVEMDAVDLGQVNASTDRFAHLLDLGASPVGTSFALVVLEGNRSDTVRIVDADIERDCSEPLDGSLFLDPPAGADDSLRLDFDLDAPDPVATRRSNETGEPVQVFPAETISLAPEEQVSLVVTGSTSQQSCDFRVRFTVLHGDARSSILVPDASEPPFRVTARLEESAYQSVYLGGVACGVGEFVLASETYFATGTEPACVG
ncbi:hypothetical protein [Agromyces sp. Marseille-P2726]|uniref:hypothetical protein n=1 Tax=Agromyces sp. Marseille-P2726 TaxID=2709132 RepID=UPI00157050A6|nr:hypothetical protein [Agromyces sp. Marseille-P2726]